MQIWTWTSFKSSTPFSYTMPMSLRRSKRLWKHRARACSAPLPFPTCAYRSERQWRPFGNNLLEASDTAMRHCRCGLLACPIRRYGSSCH
jgi:hypothetical protein